MDTKWPRMATTIRLIAVFLGIVCAGLLCLRAEADEYAAIMAGTFRNAKTSPVEAKFAQAGYRERLGLGFYAQGEVGAWVQKSTDDGRRSSAYVAGMLGAEADGPLTVRVAFGPALITSPDSYLGGPIQFTEDLFVGIRGKSEIEIGAKMKHFSSAGFEMPNVGRDFAGIELALPF